MDASVIFRLIVFLLLLSHISSECFPGCSCGTDRFGRLVTVPFVKDISSIIDQKLCCCAEISYSYSTCRI